MSERLRALIVEDSKDDSELVAHELRRAGYDVEHLRVQTADAMREALAQHGWDVILSDYSMPEFSALAAMGIAKEMSPDTPCIIVSGTVDEETAVEALKGGAVDFMSKERLARLAPAVRRELAEARVRREHRRAQEALRESELKYRRIVETTQEGICVVDKNNRITYVNRRMAAMFGGTPDDILGRPVFDFMDDEGKAAALRNFQRRQQGITDTYEFRFRRLDDSDFWASVCASPISDDQGAFVGGLAMVTDITEQRKLQEQLLMSERMVSVGMLAAGVAHEINNPLTTVLGNLELATQDLEKLLQQHGDEPGLAALRDELNDARDAGNRVRGIVRDLKIFSRAGEEDARELVDVRQVLESTLRLAWNEIRHRARLVKDYGQVPPIEANESRLGQVFLNLIVNAAQAIEEGRAEANEIRVTTKMAADGRVIVEIKDTGAGMSPDVKRRLFTPFFTTKPIGVGTGLGLSICHKIVTAIGGEIRVESEPGHGTSFQIVLIAVSSTTREQREQASPKAVAVRRGRVLVVDDEPTVATTVQRVVGTDHEVVATTKATEALEMIQAGDRFDAILCDLMMPHMTGMQLYEALHDVASDQAGRIIFLTGGAFTPTARAFLNTVQNLRMDKPFDAAALRAMINDRVR